MALHIISSENKEALNNAIEASSNNDDLIFIQNGCYHIKSAPPNSYFLSESIKQRGLQEQIDRLDNIRLASAEGFVKLTEKHQQVLTWF